MAEEELDLSWMDVPDPGPAPNQPEEELDLSWMDAPQPTPGQAALAATAQREAQLGRATSTNYDPTAVKGFSGSGGELAEKLAETSMPVFTAIDTLARPVRTSIEENAKAAKGVGMPGWLGSAPFVGLAIQAYAATQGKGPDLGRAFESIYKPKVAATTESMLKETTGYETQAAGADRTWGKATLDFFVNLGAGAITDPTTYLSFGISTVAGRGIQGAAKTAAAGLGKTKTLAEAIADIMAAGAKHGTKLTDAQAQAVLRGTMSFGEEVATGQRSLIGIGAPFGVTAKNIVPESVQKRVLGLGEKASEALGVVAGGAEATLPGVTRAGKEVQRFVSSSAGSPLYDSLLNRAATDAANLKTGWARESVAMHEKLNKLGIAEAHKHYIDDIIQATMSKEQLAKLSEKIGVSVDDLAARWKERFPDGDLERQMVNDGLTLEQRTAMRVAAEDQTRLYREAVDAERAAGHPVADLGAGTLAAVDTARNEVIKQLEQMGVGGVNRLVATAEGKAKNLLEILDSDEFAYLKSDAAHSGVEKEFVKAYKDSLDRLRAAEMVAATIPGYSPLRVSREAVDAIVESISNSPGKGREMAQLLGARKGQLLTRAEAVAAVQEAGTALTAGQAVKGRVKILDLIKTLNRGRKAGGLKGMAAELDGVRRKAGKLFEEHPALILGDRMSAAAETVADADFVKGLKEGFGTDLPSTYKATKALKEQAENDLRALLEQQGKTQREQGRLFADLPGSDTSGQYAVQKRLAEDAVAKHSRNLEDMLTHGVDIPEGYGLASKYMKLPEGVDDFLLPSDIIQMHTRRARMLADPQTYRQLGGAYRAYNRAWKTATLFAGTFLENNKIGNYLNRMNFGGMDALSGMDEYRFAKIGIGRADPKTVMVPIGGGKTISVHELIQEGVKHGSVDSGFLAHELAERMHFGASREHVATRALKAPFRAVRNIAQAIENYDKLGHMAVRLRAGDTMAQAADSANTALYNYRVVSPLVNRSRTFGMAPFAAFAAKSVPAYAKLLVTKPGTMAFYAHALRGMEGKDGHLTEDDLPPSARGRGAVRIHNADGTTSLIFGDNMIPMRQLLSAVDDPVKYFSGIVGPIPKALADWLNHMNPWGDKDAYRRAEELDTTYLLPGMDPFVTSKITKRTVKGLVPLAPGLSEDWNADAEDTPDYRYSATKRLLGVPSMSTYDPREQALWNDKAQNSELQNLWRLFNHATHPAVKAAYQRQINDLERSRGLPITVP